MDGGRIERRREREGRRRGKVCSHIASQFPDPWKKKGGGGRGVGEEESVSHRLTLLCEK